MRTLHAALCGLSICALFAFLALLARQYRSAGQVHLAGLMLGAALHAARGRRVQLAHLDRFAADGMGLRLRHTWLALDFAARWRRARASSSWPCARGARLRLDALAGHFPRGRRRRRRAGGPGASASPGLGRVERPPRRGSSASGRAPRSACAARRTCCAGARARRARPRASSRAWPSCSSASSSPAVGTRRLFAVPRPRALAGLRAVPLEDGALRGLRARRRTHARGGGRLAPRRRLPAEAEHAAGGSQLSVTVVLVSPGAAAAAPTGDGADDCCSRRRRSP